MTWCRDATKEPPKVAFAIQRKVGTAVDRNALRRRLKAILRVHADELSPGSYLVGAAPTSTSLGYPELEAFLLGAITALHSQATSSGTTRSVGSPG